MSFLDRVKEIPITDYAQRIGFTVVRKGKYYSLAEHDSVMIDSYKNCFWRNSRYVRGQKGSAGSVIDFAIEFGGAGDVKSAMRQIAVMYGIDGEKEVKAPVQKSVLPKEPVREAIVARRTGVILPEKDEDNRNVFAYLLKTRGIEESVIRYFIRKGMLYQDKKHKNCVFHTGTIFGCVRGTVPQKRFVSDLEGCDYNECFFFRGSEDASTLIVTESVIDTMSIMSQLYREEVKYTGYCYLALSGTNKLESVFYHIEQEAQNGHPINFILIATDNDAAGEKAADKIAQGLNEYDVEYARYAPPEGKDWNEYILLSKNE